MKKIYLTLLFSISLLTFCEAQWIPQGNALFPGKYAVVSSSIVDSNTVWAVANDVWTPTDPTFPTDHLSKVLRTIDGGNTWKVLDIEETQGRYTAMIVATDSTTAWISTQSFNNGTGRGLFKTTNGGEDWTEILNDPAGAGWLHFFDSQHWILLNQSAKATSFNGGNDWETGSIAGFLSGEFAGAWSSSSNIASAGDQLWFGTSKGRVFHSDDRGENWSINTPNTIANKPIHSMAFAEDGQQGVALYRDGVTKAAKTLNGGADWELIDLPINVQGIEEVAYIPETDSIFVVAAWNNNSSTFFLEFDDEAENWIEKDDQTQIFAPTFKSINLGWAGDFRPDSSFHLAPTMQKWNAEMVLDAVELIGISNEVNVYPNPVSDELKMNTGELKILKIEIANLAGEVIYLIQPTSSNDITINTSNMIGGIYFLKFYTGAGILYKKIIKS